MNMSMKKQIRFILASLLTLCLTVCGTGYAEEDPVVVRVGETSYTLSEAQFSLAGYADLALTQGETLTEERQQELIDLTVDHLVGLAVIENKLKQLGVNDFSENETEILTANARKQYESTWQALYENVKAYSLEVTEKEITDWMTAKGYTIQAFLRELMVNERENRALDLFCSDVTVTEEEILEYYHTYFLDPDTESYADDIPLYEKEILDLNNESFYTPEGYRYIKDILLDIPEIIDSEMKTIYLEGQQAALQAQSAYGDLAAAAAAGEDTASAKEAYDRKMAAVHELEAKYAAKAEEAIPLLQEIIDTIRTRLREGTGIETLLREYSTDQTQTGTDKLGVPYHTQSEKWADGAKKVIDAMNTPGELSEPFADENGVHLYYYAAEIPGGPRLLTLEENESLRSSALMFAKRARLEELVEEWKKGEEIFIDASGLTFE